MNSTLAVFFWRTNERTRLSHSSDSNEGIPSTIMYDLAAKQNVIDEPVEKLRLKLLDHVKMAICHFF